MSEETLLKLVEDYCVVNGVSQYKDQLMSQARVVYKEGQPIYFNIIPPNEKKKGVTIESSLSPIETTKDKKEISDETNSDS